MDGYLVLASCTLDDVPVSFHADRGEAFDAAEALTGIPPDLAELFPASTFEVAKVVRFQSGRPVEVVVMHSTNTSEELFRRELKRLYEEAEDREDSEDGEDSP